MLAHMKAALEKTEAVEEAHRARVKVSEHLLNAQEEREPSPLDLLSLESQDIFFPLKWGESKHGKRILSMQDYNGDLSSRLAY